MSNTPEEREYDRQIERDAVQERIAVALERILEVLKDMKKKL